MNIDHVLSTPRRPVTTAQACEAARAGFSMDATAAEDLGSERDQTFLVYDSAGRASGVMKVSNPSEQPETLDMEALAAQRVRRVDAQLPVAQPRRTSEPTEGVGGLRFAARFDGVEQWVRLYDVLPGRGRVPGSSLDDAAIREMGRTTARVDHALRGFIHPKAVRTLLWDIEHTLVCRELLPAIGDRATRAAVEAVFDRFEDIVTPCWPSLRSQVIHGDMTVDNVLLSDTGAVTAILDFGDMSFTALIADVACVLDSVCAGRHPSDLFRTARIVLDGYQGVTPLEDIELAVLAELWAARSAITIAIGSWRAAEGLEDPQFAQRFTETAMAVIEHILTTGWVKSAELLSTTEVSEHPRSTVDDLVTRRLSAFGPAIEPLSYHDPIEMVSASGVWMTDAAGRRYLDMYNNVPCVGHSHPRVVGAVGRQWPKLNTNLRYLHPGAIELAERLKATMPPELDTVLFVNSGSEANDLAWRLATCHSGHTGGMCTQFAYHGVTAAVAPFSPETFSRYSAATPVERWQPPDALRGQHLGTQGFAAAIERLAARGFDLAAVMLDGVLMSDGVLDLAPQYVRDLVTLTRRAGGLWIADEVQGGHGRTGDAMWSFQRFGIIPDFVTLGKAMGNGQPIGAVITRREIAESYSQDSVFFSTFAGNQVSIAAATAVLDVIADERIMPRVHTVGEQLRTAIQTVVAHDDRVADVRGMGLANGIEIVDSRASATPDHQTAGRIKERLRQLGVLVGTTGPFGNVLKVRPPLAFDASHIGPFAAALAESLSD